MPSVGRGLAGLTRSGRCLSDPERALARVASGHGGPWGRQLGACPGWEPRALNGPMVLYGVPGHFDSGHGCQ